MRTHLSLIALAIVADLPSPAYALEHEVQRGETLQAISQKYFGTTRKWHALFQANRELLKTPQQVEPGMKLRIVGKKDIKIRVDQVRASETIAKTKNLPVELPKRLKTESPSAIDMGPLTAANPEIDGEASPVVDTEIRSPATQFLPPRRRVSETARPEAAIPAPEATLRPFEDFLGQ
jgi:LysM repeat protein